MGQNRSELLDQAILRLVDLSRSEQDRIAIEILADLCSEEEWAVVVASEPYRAWLAAQLDEKPGRERASLSTPAV